MRVFREFNGGRRRFERVIRRLLVTKRRIVKIKSRSRHLKLKILHIRHRKQNVKSRIAKAQVMRARLIKRLKLLQSTTISKQQKLNTPKRPLNKPDPKRGVNFQGRKIKRIIHRIAIYTKRLQKLTSKNIQLKVRLLRVSKRRQRQIKRVMKLRKHLLQMKLRYTSVAQRSQRLIMKYISTKGVRRAVKVSRKQLVKRVMNKKLILRSRLALSGLIDGQKVAQRRRAARIIRVLRKKIAKRVVRRVKRITKRITRAKVRATVNRRRTVGIKRRQIQLRRRIHRIAIGRRQIRRRIEAARIKRVKLIRRVKQLKLKKQTIQRLLAARPKDKSMSKRIRHIDTQIKRATHKIAICKLRVITLRRRRVQMKARIHKIVKRQRRLRRRLVATRHRIRRQMKRMRKLVVKERKFTRRMVKKKLINRRTIIRTERQIRKVIRRRDRNRRPAVLIAKRVFISGSKVVLPRLVNPARRHVPGIKRKVAVFKRIRRKLHAQNMKVLRQLSARALIRKVIHLRPRVAIAVSVKKVLGGKKLLKVTKAEVVARKILQLKKPIPVKNLKIIQSSLREKLVQLKRKLATVAPAFKRLVQQKKAAYESDEVEVSTGFANSITESTETYNQIINKQKYLYNTEYNTLVSEEHKTAEAPTETKSSSDSGWITVKSGAK